MDADQPRPNKHRVIYPSLSEALKHDWKTLTPKQARHQNITLVLYIMSRFSQVYTVP